MLGLKNLETNFNSSKAALIVGFLTLASRLVGLLRDRLFASKFGAGDILDAYYAAFRIPDLIFNLLVLGTLSVAFIPVFTSLLIKDKQRAIKNANTVLNFSAGIMTLFCLLLLLLSKPLTHLLVPGFTGQKLQNTLLLTRIFLLSPIIFTISNVFSSVLNASKRFFIVGFAPVLYNLGIIFGLLVLYPKLGIMGLGLGVILGAVLHALCQIPEVLSLGFSWQPVLDIKDEAVRKIGRLFLPRIIGVDNSQVSLLIGSVVGSVLASGSIAVFTLANNLQAVPVGIFAISSAVAIFPVLSEEYARQEHEKFLNSLRETIVQISFYIIPISILLLLLRAHAVRLAFGAGKFNWDDTRATFQVLGIFSISLFTQALSPLFSRAFYARHNTKIPVVINLGAMALNAFLAYYLGLRMGISGVAWGFTLSSILNAIALFVVLHYSLSESVDNSHALRLFDQQLVDSLLKILAASLAMGLVTYAWLYALAPWLDTHTGLGLLVQSGVSAFFGLSTLFVCAYYVKLPQAVRLARKLF
ncbi:MAG: murein biosynthesis integral membrane protein MurJ [Patescibacteria group bacterium]|nr:murein biosynthesis integral membrane protein MurJ [Patescibacteria group bacterium]